MHIVNIIYNKSDGGLEKIFLDYNEYCLQLGHKVTAIAPPDAMINPAIRAQQVPIIPSNLIASSIHNKNPFAALYLRRIFKRIKPDLILIHNARTLELIQKAAKGICSVACVHHGGKTKRLMRAKNVICVAKYMIEELRISGLENANFYYVPNSIKLTRNFTQAPLPKGNFPKGKCPVVIGYIGRLSHEKGVDILLSALTKLEIPYKALIAGDGPLRVELEKSAKDHNLSAEFLGWISSAQKDDFFNKCDMLLVPSRQEPFGLVILEGWLYGVPVISSKSKGGCELIQHKADGLLFDICDEKSLREAILSMDKTTHQRLINGGRAKLERLYTPDHARELFDSAIGQLLN
ncbi:MAG: hypothetical protein COA94_06585 [Rickettsiales bacterium]|nr:MAG: hypothetical protein COA94_06585 [Rickettsiales bacterium]